MGCGAMDRWHVKPIWYLVFAAVFYVVLAIVVLATISD
jgi:hypothetical protein